jgi:hypothetical protein
LNDLKEMVDSGGMLIPGKWSNDHTGLGIQPFDLVLQALYRIWISFFSVATLTPNQVFPSPHLFILIRSLSI